MGGVDSGEATPIDCDGVSDLQIREHFGRFYAELPCGLLFTEGEDGPGFFNDASKHIGEVEPRRRDRPVQSADGGVKPSARGAQTIPFPLTRAEGAGDRDGVLVRILAGRQSGAGEGNFCPCLQIRAHFKDEGEVERGR